MIEKTEYLNLFRPISLAEMDCVKLMNRVDKKFVLPACRLASLMNNVSSGYSILEINSQRCFQYTSVYFDTRSMAMYYDHHNGCLNRYKIRHRTYNDTNTGFLEIKLKTNKNRTVKNRIPVSFDYPFSSESTMFLSSMAPFAPDALEPMLKNNFNRITLVDIVSQERVTIDRSISFRSEETGNIIELPEIVVCEIKQDRRNGASRIETALENFGYKTCSISKYCIGSALLNHNVRTNNFKSKLRKIEKIQSYNY